MTYGWRIWVAVFLLIWVLLLAGCVQMTTHVTVNKDGSIDVENSFLVEKSLLAMAQEDKSEDPFVDLRRRL